MDGQVELCRRDHFPMHGGPALIWQPVHRVATLAASGPFVGISDIVRRCSHGSLALSGMEDSCNSVMILFLVDPWMVLFICPYLVYEILQ